MNFFDYQDRARVWTRWLVGLYALAVIGIMNALNGKEEQLPVIGQFASNFKF